MSGPALTNVEHMVRMTNLPPSVNGSLFLYAAALTSVMCIGAICASVLVWMIRDTWRDRKNVKYNTVLFNFRMIFGLLGFAGILRTFPEALYLQIYGDPKVSLGFQAAVTTAKRIADSTSLLFVMSWVGLFVMIYPFVCKALQVEKQGEVISHLTVDDYPSIKRLTRPFICFILTVLVAMAFAFGKVYHT